MIENPDQAFAAIGARIDACKADGSPAAIKQGELLNRQRLMMIREMIEQSKLSLEDKADVEIALRRAHKACNSFAAGG